MTSSSDRGGFEGDYEQLQGVLDRLVHETRARSGVIVDGDGPRLLAASGDLDGLDVASLASLSEGDTEHEGDRVHVRSLNSRATLITIADMELSGAGMCEHLKVASEELRRIFDRMLAAILESKDTSVVMGVFCEGDIDDIFRD